MLGEEYTTKKEKKIKEALTWAQKVRFQEEIEKASSIQVLAYQLVQARIEIEILKNGK